MCTSYMPFEQKWLKNNKNHTFYWSLLKNISFSSYLDQNKQIWSCERGPWPMLKDRQSLFRTQPRFLGHARLTECHRERWPCEPLKEIFWNSNRVSPSRCLCSYRKKQKSGPRIRRQVDGRSSKSVGPLKYFSNVNIRNLRVQDFWRLQSIWVVSHWWT